MPQEIQNNHHDSRRIVEELEQRAGRERMEAARRRSEAARMREAERALAEFAAAWNDLVGEYAERGTFNAKKARRLQRAWSDLARANLWSK
jgi:hypothetical protein